MRIYQSDIVAVEYMVPYVFIIVIRNTEGRYTPTEDDLENIDVVSDDGDFMASVHSRLTLKEFDNHEALVATINLNSLVDKLATNKILEVLNYVRD